jgi:hypothetical protein
MNKWGGTWPEDETDEEYEYSEGHAFHKYQFLATPDAGISRPVREGEPSAEFTPGHRLGMPAFLVEMQHSVLPTNTGHRRADANPQPPRPPRLSNISSPGDAIDATTGNAHVFAHSFTPAEAWKRPRSGAGEWPGNPSGVRTTYGQYAQLGGGGYLSLTQFADPPERLDPDSAWSGQRFNFEGDTGLPVNYGLAEDQALADEEPLTDDTNKRNIQFAPDMVRIAHGAWQKQQQDWASILRGD